MAVLGAGDDVSAFCDELRRWTDDLVVIRLGDEGPRDGLPPGVVLADRPGASVASADGDGDLEGVCLDDGSLVACDAVFLRTDTVAVTDLAAHLGCQLDDDGLVVVDADCATTVERVFAAGDCTPGPQLVQVAAAEGAVAGLSCARAARAVSR